MALDGTPHNRCKPNCSMCPAGAQCFTDGLASSVISQWNDLVQTHMPLFPGAGALFSAGDTTENLYLVRAGCVKSYTVDADGNERIRGFHLPGDLVGLDAIAGGRHPSSAAAVGPSQLCVIPLHSAFRALGSMPDLLKRLLERTSVELSAALSMSGDYTAEQRVAAFLLDMHERMAPLSGKLRLPMTRRDIGNYLRLATETVCRVITRLENQGVLEAVDRALVIRDFDRIETLAEPVGLIGDRNAATAALAA